MKSGSASPAGERRSESRSTPVLVKRLTRGEKNDNWIKVPASLYSFFPPASVVKTRIGRKIVTMKVNERGYMWPELLLWDQFAKLLEFDEERDELVFATAGDGTMEVSCRRQR